MAVVTHAWQDVRVPAAARLMVAFVPLYFLCPCDLNWDFLPGGYLDDLWIAVSLVTMALRMTPRAVFGDARKAMAFGALGIVLTVGTTEHFSRSLNLNLDSNGRTEIASASSIRAGDGHAQFATPQARLASGLALASSSPARLATLQVRQCPAKGPGFKLLATQPEVKTAGISTSRMALNRTQPYPVLRPVDHNTDDKHCVPAIAQARATFVSPSFLLTSRGGNFQLYACNGVSLLINALLANSQITSRRHPFEGGYLFATLDRFLIPSEAPC
jgi:uncharacterized membrane protein YkvA (DUF1232 family)